MQFQILYLRNIKFSNFKRYKEIRNKYSHCQENISVILRGINTDILDPSLSNLNMVKEVIKKYSLRDKSIKIILPGRVSFWKGHEIAIEAMAILKKKLDKDFECIFVGPENNLKLKKFLIN